MLSTSRTGALAETSRHPMTNLLSTVQSQKEMAAMFGRKEQYSSQTMQRIEGLKHLQEQRSFLKEGHGARKFVNTTSSEDQFVSLDPAERDVLDRNSDTIVR